MSARRGLGRGLDALLGDAEAPQAPPDRGVAELPVDALRPNRDQPRTSFDEEELESLAASIRAQGVIQPLVVSAGRDGIYHIVAGERRWRAAQRAGLETVPVVVREVEGDQERLELALVENLQRADLDPVEEADAYRALRDRFGLSQEAIAERVGKARTTITNTLRLLRLPEEIRELLRSGALTAGQARPLLSVEPRSRQIELARRAAAEGLTARRLEEEASGGRAGRASSRARRKSADADVHTAAAEETLTRALQTEVRIRRRGRGGTVVLPFHSEDELMRLYELLIAAGRGS